MTDLNQAQIKAPDNKFEILKQKVMKDSVMEPGFVDGLMNYNKDMKWANIPNSVGGILRNIAIDPIRNMIVATHKARTGEPLTPFDVGNTFMGLMDIGMPATFGSAIKNGVNPNIMSSITSIKPWPENFPKAFNHTSITAMKKHHGYTDAKAGDIDKAIEIARQFVKKQKAQDMGGQFPDAMLVAPHAQEASGINQIPQQVANRLSELTGLSIDDKIVQSSKAHRTGKNAAEKMVARPEFDGDIVKGQEYILVDDVMSQGGTMSELRHYIENKGGKVSAVAPLTYARGSSMLGIQNKTVQELNGRFSKNEFKNLLQEFNISGTTEALTEREGRYLLKFKSLDSIRNKLLEAKQKREHSPLLQEVSRQIDKNSGLLSGGQQ